MKSSLSLHFAAIAVCLGISTLLILPRLFSYVELGGLLLVIGLLFWIKKRLFLLLACFVVGVLWGNFFAVIDLAHIEFYSGRHINVTGTIQRADIGQSSHRILFRVNQVDQEKLTFYNRFNLVLVWPEPSTRIAAGQQWQLTVLVRPVHGSLNEGSFNNQRWSIANHQALYGIVKKSQIVDDSINLRQHLIDKAGQTIAELKHKDILFGLAFGERGLINAEQRQLLLTTGIAHLMAISGLHIGLAFMLGMILARGIQWLMPQAWIGLKFPYWLGWLVAILYTWLSGINPPAMRAMMALSLWLMLKHYCLFLSAWQSWLYIVTALLIYDPLMVLSESVWLSCGAVAALIFWFQWMPLQSRFYQKRWFLLRWFHLQFAMFCLLLPLQMTIFQGLSLSSLIYNLIAIPIVSFITVPAILMAILCCWLPSIAVYCWLIASYSLTVVFQIFPYIPSAWVTIEQSMWLFSVVGWLSVIIWRFRLWRTAPIVCLSIVFLLLNVSKNRPDYRWRLDMLDVGHGLAIVIHNGYRAVLYDTGNIWQTGSHAEQVIVPFLNQYGLVLDGIIVSHHHADHIGGLAWLKQQYPDIWLRTSENFTGFPCIQGEQWRWQNLTFDVLWPFQSVDNAHNSDSCVVKISDGQFSVLLTGDIEKPQELALVRKKGEQLKSDIIQTPHHGSTTSSSAVFLRKVQPTIALTSISRFNPWRLPSEKIKQRYQSMGILWRSTSSSGQISVLFFNENFEIYQFRQDLSRRWYNQWFGDISQND